MPRLQEFYTLTLLERGDASKADDKKLPLLEKKLSVFELFDEQGLFLRNVYFGKVDELYRSFKSGKSKKQ